MKWLDGRDDLRWWQHRHPEPSLRHAGLALMVVGVLHVLIGVATLLGA
jgi:hypothetical protein